MEPFTLEPAGWFLLISSWTAVSAGVLFCARRVLRQADARAKEPDEAPGRGETRGP